MQELTFESLITRAEKLFYSVWIEEGTPEECNFYKSYFEQYPNRGNYETFYKKTLKKHAHTLSTSWDYEEPQRYDTPQELLAAIEEAENEMQF